MSVIRPHNENRQRSSSNDPTINNQTITKLLLGQILYFESNIVTNTELILTLYNTPTHSEHNTRVSPVTFHRIDVVIINLSHNLSVHT